MDTTQNYFLNKLSSGELTEEEQTAFEARVGDLVFRSALNRLLLELSEDEVKSLESEMESQAESDRIAEYLFTSYPRFVTLFQEEAKALEEEATQTLS